VGTAASRSFVLRFPKIIAFVAGLISATGFAPLNLWPLTLTCLAILLHLASEAQSLRAAAGRGYWFGVGHFIVGMNWIAGAFRYQETMPHWLGWVAVVALAFYIAVYPALAAGAAWFLRKRFGGGDFRFVILFAASWIISEYLRSTVFTGYVWNPLGVVAVEAAWPARLVGTYGVSGLLCLGSGGLSMLWARQWRAAAAIAVSLAVIFGGSFVAARWAGVNALRANERAGYPAGPLVRIVQPNIAQQDKQDSTFDAVNFAKLEALTGKPTAEPRLILWPEAAIPDFLEEEPRARERLATLLGPKDVLLTGGDALVYGKDGKLKAARNSLFAMTADAKLIGRYDKAHLVPYGEYLPMRPLLSAIGLSRVVPGDLDFLAGPGPRTLSLPGFGKIGVQICYEIIFSGEVIDRAHRPDVLFNPSNDAWFGSWGTPEFLAQARLRAIEEGLPAIRATPTGISAIIDADGNILRSLPYKQPGFIEARLPAAHPPTLFAKYGNIIPLSLALLMMVISIAVGYRRR
jgi:apolipoprotein N-acyltransferase